jgi:hypothetical protein
MSGPVAEETIQALTAMGDPGESVSKFGLIIGRASYLHKSHLGLQHSRSTSPVQDRECCSDEDL